MKKYKKQSRHAAIHGFTLVELMITMVISGIIIAALYSAYVVQQKTYAAQSAVSDMQQNIRSAMVILIPDLRMAGYDPQGTGDFGIQTTATFTNGGALTENVTSDNDTIAFLADLDRDGTIDRAAEDVNGDGNNDMSEMEQVAYRLNGTDLQRYSTRNGVIEWQIIAENIDQIEFHYLDNDSAPVTPPLALSIQIAILARTDYPDPKFTNNQTYTVPLSGTSWPVNDNLRRRLLVTRVQLRNMGLTAP